MVQISILIADDHKLVREAWTAVLNSDERFCVIDTCGDSEHAVELARIRKPDIVLMDINITPFSGIEATVRIRKYAPFSRVIGVSVYALPQYAKKMMHAGARGYVTKNSSKNEMIEAILAVSRGEKYICQEIKDRLTGNMLEPGEIKPDISSLTERELEVTEEIRKGCSSKEIAKSLSISLKTVEVHRHNILRKLKLRNAASLVNFVNSSISFL